MLQTIKEKNLKKKKKKNSRLRFLITALGLVLLYLLQIVDFYLTLTGTSLLGLKAEGNPLVRYLLTEFGIVNGLLFVKIPALILIFSILLFLRKLYTNGLFWVVIFLNILYLFSSILWIYILTK